MSDIDPSLKRTVMTDCIAGSIGRLQSHQNDKIHYIQCLGLVGSMYAIIDLDENGQINKKDGSRLISLDSFSKYRFFDNFANAANSKKTTWGS